MCKKLGLMFILIGWIVGGLLMIINASLLNTDDWSTVNAKITRIEKVSTVNSNHSHNVYVEYTYDNVQYDEVWLSEYSSTWRVNDTIELRVNPENPTDCTTGMLNGILSVIGVFIAVIFSVVGFVIRRVAGHVTIKVTKTVIN